MLIAVKASESGRGRGVSVRWHSALRTRAYIYRAHLCYSVISKPRWHGPELLLQHLQHFTQEINGKNTCTLPFPKQQNSKREAEYCVAAVLWQVIWESCTRPHFDFSLLANFTLLFILIGAVIWWCVRFGDVSDRVLHILTVSVNLFSLVCCLYLCLIPASEQCTYLILRNAGSVRPDGTMINTNVELLGSCQSVHLPRSRTFKIPGQVFNIFNTFQIW